MARRPTFICLFNMKLLCEKLLNVSAQYSKINVLTLTKVTARAIVIFVYFVNNGQTERRVAEKNRKLDRTNGRKADYF